MRGRIAGWALVALVMTMSAAGQTTPRPRQGLPTVAPSEASDQRRRVLVELFTSEGCESCPPADALLMDLVRTQPVPGVRIVALSEHVDYWNQLGWVDPFSAPLFTQRQERYTAALRAESYTPQLVVGGREAVIGSSRAAVLAAIARAAKTAGAGVRVDVNVTQADVRVSIPANPAMAGATVTLAVSEDRLSSQVLRGENAGRLLSHDAVARRLQSLGAVDSNGVFSRTLPLPPLLNPAWKPGALHLIVFVQDAKGAVVAVSECAPTPAPFPPVP